MRRSGHRRAGREVEHFHHLVGHRLGDEVADRHAAALDAKGDVGSGPAPHLGARRREQLVDRHAERVRDLDQHDERRIARARFEVGDGRARHRGGARQRSWVRLRAWRRPARLRARWLAAERSSAGPPAAASSPSIASGSFIATGIVTVCQWSGQRAGDARGIGLPSRHRLSSPLGEPSMTHPRNIPLRPRAAARRHHRRHLRARPGPRRSVRRARRLPSPSSPAMRRACAASRARSPAATASSATSRARTTSTPSRCRSAARSAASTCCQQRVEPRPGAARAARRHRVRGLRAALATNLLGPFRLTKALLGALAASARDRRGAGSARWSSTSRATPRSRRTPAGAPTARARPRSRT